MSLFLHRFERDIAEKQTRLQAQRTAFARQANTQLAKLRKTAARPRTQALAFGAGLLSGLLAGYLHAGLRVASSTTGFAVSLYQYAPVMRRMSSELAALFREPSGDNAVTYNASEAAERTMPLGKT